MAKMPGPFECDGDGFRPAQPVIEHECEGRRIAGAGRGAIGASAEQCDNLSRAEHKAARDRVRLGYSDDRASGDEAEAVRLDVHQPSGDPRMDRNVECMRIGTPVMWANPRKRSERGHVVEGGRSYATVLREDGVRLRIRWESLLAEDRAPLRTIVTDFDRTQVRFEVDDDVVFTTRDGSTMRGTIEKLNAKRARVRCSEQRWHVPYGALRHRGEPDRDRGAQRLDEVAKEARALMDAHGLKGWTLRFGAARRRLGACFEQPRIVEIARWHAARDEPRQVTDTILHEIAHAIAGVKAGHGPAWKAIARRIGATPKARAEEKDEDLEHGAAAKARFRAGMQVSFRTRGGQRHRGTIAKMNPKRAKVECPEEVFLVPYGLLEDEGEGDPS